MDWRIWIVSTYRTGTPPLRSYNLALLLHTCESIMITKQCWFFSAKKQKLFWIKLPCCCYLSEMVHASHTASNEIKQSLSAVAIIKKQKHSCKNIVIKKPLHCSLLRQKTFAKHYFAIDATLQPFPDNVTAIYLHVQQLFAISSSATLYCSF